MSKELTEQWRNGTLPFGMYYVKTSYGDIRTDETVYLVGRKRYRWRYTDICCLEEIIASVPTYEEWVKNGTWYTEKSHNELLKKIEKLEQQLNIATNALKNAHNFPQTMSLKEYCEQALKDIKEVK